MPATTTQMNTHTVGIPGVTDTDHVRRNKASNEPPLFLFGLPMGAGGCTTHSSPFGDRTACDPRGSERSVLTDPDRTVALDDHLQTCRRRQPRKPNAT
jgi:hypothetical protein